MSFEIPEATFIKHLKKGVKRTIDLMAKVTDYHGGPTTTEYLLTSDVAREFIECHFEIQVEFLNRKIVNGITQLLPRPNVPRLGSKRTDIALLYTTLIPRALIELKIGVTTLNGIAGDLDKITNTIACMNSTYASKVIGAVVFQMHVDATKKRSNVTALKVEIERKERAIETGLVTYAERNAEFRFRMERLQGPNDGISASDHDNDGHATRFYVVLIRDKRTASPPRKLADLKLVNRR